MDIIIIFLSSELKQKYFQQELSKFISKLAENKKDTNSVSVKSIFVNSAEEITAVDRICLLSHNLQDENPTLGLPCPETLALNYKEENDEFRSSDFIGIADKLHTVADEFETIGSYQVHIIWCIETYIPDPGEVCELYACLHRMQSWHTANVVIATPDPASVVGWPNSMPLQVVTEVTQVTDSILHTVWRGEMCFNADGSDAPNSLPQVTLTCIAGKLQLLTDKNKSCRVYVSPHIQVVSRVDLATIPVILVKPGAIFQLSPAPDCLPEEVQNITDVFDELTKDFEMGVLLRLSYSDSAPSLKGEVKELTMKEWKRQLSEGMFDTFPLLHLPHPQSYHLLVIGRGGKRGSVRAVGLRSPDSLGEECWKIVNKTSHSVDCEAEEKVENLLQDTPLLSQKQLNLFAQLQIFLPKQITRKLQDRGNNISNLWEETKEDLETLASQEVLTKVFAKDSTSYFTLSNEENPEKKSELEVPLEELPEYQALINAERLENKHLTADVGGLLHPSVPVESVMTLDAKHLSDIFKNNPLLDYKNKNGNIHSKMSSVCDQYPFKCNASLKELQFTEWPEVLLMHHHDVYYNRDQKREDFEENCNGIRQRHIRREFASTCTVFNDKDMFVAIGNNLNKSKNIVESSLNADKSSVAASRKVVPTTSKREATVGDDTVSVRSGASSRRSNLLRRSPRKKTQTNVCKPSDLLAPSKGLPRTDRTLGTSNRQQQPSSVSSDLSDSHKQKLRGAILTALNEEGITMKDNIFKVSFKKLFAVCKPFVVDVIGRGSTSRNMEKIARSHVKQVIDFQLKMCK